MGLNLLYRKYNNELRPFQDLSSFLGCIGEKISVETVFYYENINISSDDNTIVFIPPISDANTLEVNNLIKCENVGFVDGLNVGDELYIEDVTTPLFSGNSSIVGSYFVKEVIQGTGQFRITVDFPSYTVFGTGGGSSADLGYIAVITPLTGIRYQYIFAETKSSDYISLIDGEWQRFVTDKADATAFIPSDMMHLGQTTYQIGSMNVVGAAPSGDTYQRQYFKVIHNAVVTPFFLSVQYDDLLLRIAPSYFLAKNSLNYISKISIGKTLQNPNLLVDLEVPEQIGVSGWFNENLNGAPSTYSVESMVMTRLSDSEIVQQLQFEEDIKIEVIIYSSSLAFEYPATRNVFGFNYLPEDESLYQNNPYDQTRNFLFDSKKSGFGLGDVNGDNFGTPMQVIKTVKTEYVDDSRAKLTAIIRFGSEAKAILSQGDFMRYVFWVICDRLDLEPEKTDKVNLLLQVDEIYVKKIKTDLVVADTVFIEHPYDESQYGQETLEMFPTDDVVANTTLSIDYTDPLVMNGNVRIQSITPRLKLKKTGQTDITLESFKINTGSYDIILGTPDLQDINFKQPRVFKREDGIRKNVLFGNDPDNSVPVDDLYAWALSYPFMNRWEYFLPLIGQSSIPSELRDVTKPFNGINNLWNRFCAVAGWELHYEIAVDLLQNGVLFEQVFADQLTSTDFESNPDWTNNSIKTFDVATGQEIENAGQKYIQGYVTSKVVATFTKTIGAVPDLDHVAMVIWIEPFEGAGISDIRMISSVYETIEESWFKSIDNSNRVVMNKTGNIFTATALIDHTKLPINPNFTMYARIYELSDDALNVRITNDLIVRKLLDGTTRLYI